MKLPLRPASEILEHARTNIIDVDGAMSYVDLHLILEMLANPHGLKLWRCGSAAYPLLLKMARGREVFEDSNLLLEEALASDVVLIDDQAAELPRDERFVAIIRNVRRQALA